jgi:hypothetical protein
MKIITKRDHMSNFAIFIEEGRKKTFAGSINWPGLCRSGKHQDSAIDHLLEYAPRYRQVAHSAGLIINLPASTADIQIVDVVEGNATTSFGAPAIILDSDHKPTDRNDFQNWKKILSACWKTFDTVHQKALGKELKKGPRGGGRDLNRIMSHIIDGDVAYLKKTALSYKPDPENELLDEIKKLRGMIQNTLERAEAEGLPEKGPRGGQIWPVRFFVRRVVWHTLDHLWEIEDRIIN